ncbi:bifunctional riboflavin kinase/FAD synthetase [Candidatus Endomicrobiellum devescovinae]|jgi:riboflavin kinase/FMN adenylyltransferase|uniref:bifunctional riboflavin kinase/FAD synthetase n=1 Tax=Candidatus Endomicrobiellum devescovinae TaxID=3242322 RepID=UPI002829EFA2|nr:bifunctional riboflavin kinase/FAD synthetase [Endomicrobium sp.]
MNKKSIVTIGTFDGVHKGHRLLIGKTVSLAGKSKLKSIVISLEKPVKKVKGLLTTCDEKLEEIKALGVDEIILINVPSEILTYTADKFFDEFLLNELNISEIVCGSDFAFGKDRKGDTGWLKKKAKNNNVKVSIVKYLKNSSKQISSSYIRTLLEKGDLKNAAKLLGRPYSFSGIPFKDKGFGKKLGFPTVNLKVNSDKLIPKGVYISIITQKDKIYPSVTSIGSRLTFNRGGKIVPETHVLNFDGIWKKTLTKVILLKKIRDEKKFKNVQALKVQISKDIAKSSKFFKFGKTV